jgi:Ca2+ transporting ATPase
MMKILTVAAVVSLICGYIQDGLHGLIEGVSIIISILIILVVTAGNEYVKEKQF